MNGRLFAGTMAAVAATLLASGCASEDSDPGSTTARKGHWVYVNSSTGSRLQDRVWVDENGVTNAQSQVKTYSAGALQNAQGPPAHNLKPMTGDGQ